jgi:hypothetical protein
MPLIRKHTTRMPRTTLAIGAVTAALAMGALSTPTPGVASAGAPVVDVFRPQLVTVDTYSRADKERLQALGLDMTEHAGHDYVEVVLHLPSELNALKAAGFTYDVRIPDLAARQLERQQLDAAYAARVKVSALPSGRTGYRVLEDYNADMEALAKKYPKLVKMFKLPRPSLDGLDIFGVEIGKNVNGRDKGKPTFLLMGVHHAREWPSGELAMEFAIDMAKNYGKDRTTTRLLRASRLIVVPVVNVDGFDLSRTDGENADLNEFGEYDPLDGSAVILGTPGRAYLRKNCRIVDGEDTPDGTCAAALQSQGGYGPGTDLNRNYGGFWGGPGAAAEQPDPTYRGAGPFSEPETENIKDIVTSRQVTMLISNHTFSNLILRPNGVNPTTVGNDGLPVGDSPDEGILKKLGAKMAAQNGYANIHGWQLYDTTGTTEDYTYNATGGFGYTFEIGPNEFHPPFEQVVDEYVGAGKFKGKGNRAAYILALRHASDKRFSGILNGKAPKGATLRLKKSFISPTWEGGFEDGIDTAIKIGRLNRFRWIVNPSTRPAVRSRTYQVLSETPFESKTIEGAVPPVPGDFVDVEYVLREKTALTRIALDWATPDDLDMEVYKKQGDSMVEVGSSGAAPPEKEQVDLVNAEPGTYIIRVINYSSISPTFELTTELYKAITKTTPGKKEKYTMTCEVGGKVVETRSVFIDRGQVKNFNFKKCFKAARKLA